ncbi:hypothetical protein B0H66DRAFT_177018 [Apodospora peruviana]|uniref:Uncharacterized protein n=1 Tax=Apodospora peruviana TaxID=516989 RepID=A0AAE0IC90_9PEZI|nr:hypothetical protein B0H66DRAFT_177018 [Apodospora peruviana]
MAPSKRAGKGKGGSSSSSSTTSKNAKTGDPPRPLKRAPENLQAFTEWLSKKHIYIAHIDGKPRDFKRKIFAVPVLMNLVVALAFAWRVWYIFPYYLLLLTSTLGYANETTLRAADLTWRALSLIVARRGATFLLDFCLAVFVWPWPIEFCVGREHGSPLWWRWRVGFRDREIYVRRSRAWDQSIGDVIANGEGRNILWSQVRLATSPSLLQDKTGYLTMNGDWDLDWAAMVSAHNLVDDKNLILDTFRTLVLLHHEQFGWLCLDMNTGDNAKEDERRRQVFAFRDALAAVGKEDLFFRWIEIVQFETSQPGGFTGEKQVEIAKMIRDLFKEGGIDFDEFWKESAGSDSLAGML